MNRPFRWLLGAALLFLISTTSYAAERETLLQLNDPKFSIGPGMRITSIHGNSSLLLGGEAAILLKNQYYVGGAGYGTTSDVGDGFSNYSYGGIFAGYYKDPEKPWHPFYEVGLWSANISTKVSGGGSFEGSEDFGIIEPMAGMAFNIATHFKAKVGLSYKLALGIDSKVLSQSDLGGFSLNATILFGKF